MGVHIDSSSINEMAVEFESLPRRARHRAAGVLSDIAHDGHRSAQRNARRTAGKHGKHYWRAITLERADDAGLEWVYGPDVALRQGNMSFERGSRNQKPHLDLAQSADLIRPRLRRVTDVMADELHGR